MAPLAGTPPRWLTPEFVWHYAVRPHAAMATILPRSSRHSPLPFSCAGYHTGAGLPLHHRPPCDSAAVACGPAVPAAGRAAGLVAAVPGGPVRPPVAVLQTRAARPLRSGAPVCPHGAAGACLPGLRRSLEAVALVADSTPAPVAQLAAVRPASSLAFDVLVGVGFTGACVCRLPRVRNACAVAA